MEESSFDNKKIDELLELTRENNKMLTAQHRAKKMEAVKSIIKLAIIVAVMVIAYRFINPYIQNAQKIYESVSTQIENISDTAQKLQTTGEELNTAGDKVKGFFDGFRGQFDDFSQQ